MKNSTKTAWKSLPMKTAALCAVLPLALAGCVSTETEDSADSVNTVKNGVLSVCTNTPYKPFEYEENGKVIGMDADIANAIAKDLGLDKAELTSISFEALDSGSGLDAGQCDIALAGIGVTEARSSAMSFTTVYFEDNQAILVPKSSTIKSVEDLKGKKVGAQQATNGEEYAKNAGAEVTQYEDTELMFAALKTGQIQAVSANLSVISEAIANDSSFKVAYQSKDNAEQIAGAVSKSKPNLLSKVNASLEKLKNSGKLAEIQSKWIKTGV
ncbi:MAG: ABC transporter substrate-binding protein [Rothia sp. (in: high G+C Gram-positive bacteria)]|uniref:ABC transporter substrate-binding protein n=1 Tax=Rothia sp. (in: high G+C Gram-positive bacteria) TaxID=1885016 RepID=UPI0026E0AB0D|nr:ABC transporter substrate-binding protein [Rothia sp. (in: high G+C Gram-positive bacteria)]MDO5751139.1 ABC transporter substrate-binding protein [Rothia sp. (in: high G+C Gram-positive bacteria)]